MGEPIPRSFVATNLPADRMSEFVELYTGHYPRLQYYVMALLPTANDAADVLQETSLVLWRKFDAFEPGTNFFAWACKIARLQAMKHRERQGKAARVLDIVLFNQIADEACNESVVHGVTMHVLEQCMEKLRAVDRNLIRRRYQPGTTLAQLAADVGRSANSLSKSLGRIRRSLLECIGRTQSQEWR